MPYQLHICLPIDCLIVNPLHSFYIEFADLVFWYYQYGYALVDLYEHFCVLQKTKCFAQHATAHESWQFPSYCLLFVEAI